MSSSIVRRHLVITGRVQGVFFRDCTRESAENEGVAGWVANREDGAVEAVLEGTPDAVEAVVQFCRLGPVRAHVASVQITEQPPQGLNGFETR